MRSHLLGSRNPPLLLLLENKDKSVFSIMFMSLLHLLLWIQNLKKTELYRKSQDQNFTNPSSKTSTMNNPNITYQNPKTHVPFSSINPYILLNQQKPTIQSIYKSLIPKTNENLKHMEGNDTMLMLLFCLFSLSFGTISLPLRITFWFGFTYPVFGSRNG